MKAIFEKSVYVLRYKNPIVFLAIVGIFILTVRFILGYYSTEKIKLKKITKKLNSAREEMYAWQKTRKNYKELSKEFFKEDTLFFKKFVEESARKSRVSIDSLRSSREDRGHYWEMSMHLTLGCSYEEFTNFLGFIETKSVAVESVKLNKEDEKMNIGVALKGFVLK